MASSPATTVWSPTTRAAVTARRASRRGASAPSPTSITDGNADDGIDVGADGLFDGSHSLVTNNSAHGNGDVGIEVQCASDVTNNTADRYKLISPPACRNKNNRP